ncbi:MAG: hypothetical protein E6Q98_18735 [Rhodospirillaceae bacterium]|nr:MAG: hypothetical protein E6Q98_18735 [Rhodospirillaceae bacterium]
MEPQTSPSKNDTITAPTASPRLPVNADANAQGGVPAERFGPIGNRTDIKQAIEAKQLGDRFGLNYDLVLRNLDRLRQAAALEDVTFGKFHLPFRIGEGTDAGSGNPAETPQSALNDKAQATSPSSRPSSAKKSDANHRFKSDAGEIISHAESTKKSTHRGFIGELLTTIGRNTPGKPFDIEIRGSVPVSARGKRE